jgi:GTP-binding protein YchF
MKEVGIIGMPYSGKSTLFTALTRAGTSGGRANQAVVDVPDERLGVLAEIERSARIVPAKVSFVDVPGALGAQGLARHRQSDALCVVVRAFGPDADPVREHADVEAELLVADLSSLEPSLERVRKRARASAEARVELEVLERVHAVLEEGRRLQPAELDPRAPKVLKGYGLLTLKPWIVVANVEEGRPSRSGLPEGAIAISAALEAEVAGLDPPEAEELLNSFGVERPGLERVIAACYRALDLITFLTTGEDETRAWEVARGATAPRAAGVIHSDLERGFIRAEVVSYDDLVAAGSWDGAKAKGRLRIEGKDYVVQEGDVMHVRFAV